MKALEWKNESLFLLNQTILPEQTEWIECKSVERVGEAIKRLEVRGAPAIGVAAGFGLVLAARESKSKEEFLKKALILKEARPTAVNLMWAIDKLVKKIENIAFEDYLGELEKEAQRLLEEDILMNHTMAQYGAQLFDKPVTILTHCNTGSLATAGYGTALGVIRKLWEEEKLIEVYVDETRPLLQGARLTAYELVTEQIPANLISEKMASREKKTKKIDAIIVGADRIAQNGDTANKIGTYSLAVLAKAHNIPFYIAAPYSTFDDEIHSGGQIVIEEREGNEIRKIGEKWIAPREIETFNPAFDVTPGELITGIITDKGVFSYPYENTLKNWKENNK